MKEIIQYSADSPILVVDDEDELRDISDFSDGDEPLEANSESGHDADVLASRTVRNKEAMPLQYPESLQQCKVRIAKIDLARSAMPDRPLSTYEELGGGLSSLNEPDYSNTPKYRPLDSAIRGSEDWHVAVYDAVERFGMNELTMSDYNGMSSQDKNAFSIRFKRFYDLTCATKRMIDAVDGDPELDSRLLCINGLGARSQAELNEYSSRLTTLKQGLDSSAVTNEIISHVNNLRLRQTKRCRINTDKVDYRDLSIAFKIKPNGSRTATRV